jgi:acetyl-CoA acetyltransferase
MTYDGFANPFAGMQMIKEANEVFKELEISRNEMCRFAEPSRRTVLRGKGDSC